jgi:integrase
MSKIIPPLTDAAIRNTKPTGKPRRLFDGAVVGLHVLIQPSGAKLWRLRYTINKKEKRISLGDYPGASLLEARTTAGGMLAQVRQGIDPAAPIVVEKKITFGEVTKDYIYLSGRRKSEQRIAKIQQALDKHVLPDWQDREIDKIKAGDVIKLLQKTEKSGAYIAICVHRYIGWILDHAISRGDIDSMPVTKATLNHVAPHHATSVRSMEFNRLPDFLSDLVDYRGTPITKHAMQFIMLTAIRTIELRRLQWAWIDFDKAIIKIPADQHKTGIRNENVGKDGDDFYVLLSRQALRILEKAKVITGGADLVFPSPYDHSKMASDAIINKSLDRMGWKDEHDGHGFRALFRSQMEKEGYDTKLLELCLGHALGRSKTENAYARGMNLAFHPDRLKIMQAWADLIDSIKKP